MQGLIPNVNLLQIFFYRFPGLIIYTRGPSVLRIKFIGLNDPSLVKLNF